MPSHLGRWDDVQPNGHPSGEGTARPGFVVALALIVLPILLLAGGGFVNDIEGSWRLAMAPAYAVGAYVAPVVLGRKAVRRGVPGGKALVAALGLGSLVLFLDLVVFASVGAGLVGFLHMGVVAGGALGLAMTAFASRVAIPPRPDLP